MDRHSCVAECLKNFVRQDDDEDYESVQMRLQAVANCKVLVAGAGGLGCEVLKDLALSGFKTIHVIDIDTIDVTNLNRQFLFRESDVGSAKAEVAARKIELLCRGVSIIPHFCKIQDMRRDFYADFQLVVAGLDNVEARRYLNAVLCNLVQFDEDGEIEPDSVIPMIDGGSEGLKGHVRVIVPYFSPCFECVLDMFPPAVTYPMCTIANRPRMPEHCIEYVLAIQWERERPGQKFDADVDAHLSWALEKADSRAKEFGIEGVTEQLVSGVAKNIIPAVASTNAIIAAACVSEAFKYASEAADALDNFMLFNGGSGVYSYAFSQEQKDDCPVCGTRLITRTFPPAMLLSELVADLKRDSGLSLQKPCLRTEKGESLYFSQPDALEQATRSNLNVKLGDLVSSGDVLVIADSQTLGDKVVRIRVRFYDMQ